MGHQATVIIHLDALKEIAEDPNFGKKLADAVLQKSVRSPQGAATISFNAVAAGTSTTAGVVVEVHHSDETITIEAGGNTGRIKRKARAPGWGM